MHGIWTINKYFNLILKKVIYRFVIIFFITKDCLNQCSLKMYIIFYFLQYLLCVCCTTVYVPTKFILVLSELQYDMDIGI